MARKGSRLFVQCSSQLKEYNNEGDGGKCIFKVFKSCSQRWLLPQLMPYQLEERLPRHLVHQ